MTQVLIRFQHRQSLVSGFPVLMMPIVIAGCALSTEPGTGNPVAQRTSVETAADTAARSPESQSPLSGNDLTVSEGEDDSAVFTRTIVLFDEKGLAHSSSGSITRAEQRQESVERLAEALNPTRAEFRPEAVVEACNSSYYTVIYSQPNWSGNEACFYNNSTTPIAVDLVQYRQTFSIFSSDWFQCAPDTLRRLNGPCSAGGTSAVQSYSTFTNACFSQSEGGLRSAFFFTNILGASTTVPSNVTTDEFLWLSESGAECSLPIIYYPFY
jgi:hypothetical protein